MSNGANFSSNYFQFKIVAPGPADTPIQPANPPIKFVEDSVPLRIAAAAQKRLQKARTSHTTAPEVMAPLSPIDTTLAKEFIQKGINSILSGHYDKGMQDFREGFNILPTPYFSIYVLLKWDTCISTDFRKTILEFTSKRLGENPRDKNGLLLHALCHAAPGHCSQAMDSLNCLCRLDPEDRFAQWTKEEIAIKSQLNLSLSSGDIQKRMSIAAILN